MRCLRDGFAHHLQSVKSGFTPPIIFLNQLIHLYSKHGLLPEARKLFDEMPERNVFSWNTIISAYIRSQNLTEARKLFDSTSQRDLVTYNSILSGYVNADGYNDEAIRFFVEMRREPDFIRIDDFTVATVLNLCANLFSVCYGMQLHGFMAKTGNELGFGVSSLINMYSKCKHFKEAFQVFEGCNGGVDVVSKNAMVAACCKEGDMEMALKIFLKNQDLNDVVSWNTMIAGYSQNGYGEESLNFFVRMAEGGFKWDEHTIASILNACSLLKNLKLGKEVHARVLRDGFCSNTYISTGIVDVYCKSGNLKYAESMHSTFGTKNSFSITSMIVGYSSLGKMTEARKLFDSLTEKNVVVWTAMFTGYVKSQQCYAVFELLNDFKSKEGIPTDSLILVSLLSTCALQAAIDPGMQIHAYILRTRQERDKKLIAGLIDMYSKCGNIQLAENIFRMVDVRYLDSVIYNIIISGYANHGYDAEAIQVFEEMTGKGLRPDEITFIALLSACRHRGLVEKGEIYFNSMTEVYNIVPEDDHYACMIDLYGRANKLDKAVDFLSRIPFEENGSILGAFLNACKINQNFELARETEERLLRIEGSNGGRYVQLANVYAAEGKWGEMRRIRKNMRGKEVKKFAGCSWVYLDNRVKTFTSGDVSHINTQDIYWMLECLNAELFETAKG